jgi:hypothetical protein
MATSLATVVRYIFTERWLVVRWQTYAKLPVFWGSVMATSLAT